MQMAGNRCVIYSTKLRSIVRTDAKSSNLPSTGSRPTFFISLQPSVNTRAICSLAGESNLKVMSTRLRFLIRTVWRDRQYCFVYISAVNHGAIRRELSLSVVIWGCSLFWPCIEFDLTSCTDWRRGNAHGKHARHRSKKKESSAAHK